LELQRGKDASFDKGKKEAATEREGDEKEAAEEAAKPKPTLKVTIGWRSYRKRTSCDFRMMLEITMRLKTLYPSSKTLRYRSSLRYSTHSPRPSLGLPMFPMTICEVCRPPCHRYDTANLQQPRHVPAFSKVLHIKNNLRLCVTS
jgi:hypothetical protein